ncbi:MAG: zinc-binding alcohol dehydrogenase [Pseudomonadota bacterium]
MSQHLAQQLWFADAYQVAVRTQVLAPLKPGEVLVQTELSAVSAGTELLVYRGQIPAHMALDANLESLQQQPTYPLQYGYASVGRVTQITADVDASWLGKRVFAFQPHASHFIATPANLIPVPEDIGANAAVFLANMETAVNLIQDGKPGLGEQVVVLGQGIVGLLLASVLAQYPLAQLTVIEGIAKRRECALELGVAQAINPFAADEIHNVKQQLASTKTTGADLIYEVSGTPDALNLAIELSGFTSRIVIGSWYGNKSTAIALGGDAHRNQLKIITSQVSNIAPELTGRWDKARRFELTWELIRKLKPEQLISHSVALSDAAGLYRDLDQNPGEILQAVFTYP